MGRFIFVLVNQGKCITKCKGVAWLGGINSYIYCRFHALGDAIMELDYSILISCNTLMRVRTWFRYNQDVEDSPLGA